MHCRDFHAIFSGNEEKLNKNTLQQYCYSNGSGQCMCLAVYGFFNERLHLHLLLVVSVVQYSLLEITGQNFIL